MLMNRSGSMRMWRLGAAISLLGLVGCADVDAPDADEAPLAQEAPHADLGKGNGSDVVTIGDSWMSNTLELLFLRTGGGISSSLKDTLRLNYKNYAVQGVLLLKDSGFGPAIPTQWEAATRANKNIKTVIMTAGGNDVLQDPGAEADCRRGGAKCKATLKTIAEALGTLWAQMGAAGVQDVVYVGYSENAGKSGPDAANINKNGVAEVCAAQTAIRCHAIDSTPLVPASGLVSDNIHPNKATNDVLARAVYKLLEEKGIRR
jgi:lysophospholipase L1-like esterase